MVRLVAGSILALLGFQGTALAQCEPEAAVRQILDRARPVEEVRLPHLQLLAEWRAALDAGLAEHPGDYFLLHARMSREESREARMRWAAAIEAANPRLPVYALVGAESMVGTDTPEARRRLQELAAGHPEMARPHLALAHIADTAKFKDTAAVQRELASFLALCPAPLDEIALGAVVRNGSPEAIAAVAAAVRGRLESAADPALRGVWEALWRLEFKARIATEHAAVRQRIAADIADIARFAAAPQRHELRWMAFLRSAYASAGDKAAEAAVEDEILAAFPRSAVSYEVLNERQRDEAMHRLEARAEHPEAPLQRPSLVTADEIEKRWPDDPIGLDARLHVLLRRFDDDGKKLAAAADAALAASEKEPTALGASPVELDVAEAWCRTKDHLDRFAAVVEQGYRREAARQKDADADTLTDEARVRLQKDRDRLLLARARVLLTCFGVAQRLGEVPAIDAELAAMAPANPQAKTLLLARRAQAAELEGRRLDALALYRAASQGESPPFGSGEDTETWAATAERLWQQLGGTPAAYAVLGGNVQPAAAKQARASDAAAHWERPDAAVPAFALGDLAGKVWRLEDLHGKITLVNVWATWCVPCRFEHPEFQKLYDRLKDRQDVAVLSFAVDDDTGKIAPYMQEHHYTFPVVPARGLVDSLVDQMVVPQTWFLDATGRLAWKEVGYRSGSDYQKAVMAKLDEMLHPPPH
jgi:thiol-disulfide isomerase/thioredoxin